MRSLASHLFRAACVQWLGACAVVITGCAASAHEDGARDETEQPAAELATTSYAATTVNGTGCRAGTWSASGDPLNGDLQLTFSAFEAKNAPPTATAISDCTLLTPALGQAGTKSAIARFTVVGSAEVPAGATANLSFAAYAQGSGGTSSARVSFSGGFQGEFRRNLSIPDEELRFTPCGYQRSLNLSAHALVSSASAVSLKVTSIEDISIVTRACTM